MAGGAARGQGNGEATARLERPGRRGARPDGAGNVLGRGDSGKGPRTAVGKSVPDPRGLSGSSCLAMAFLWALPFCTYAPQPLQRALRLRLVSSCVPGLKTGEHRREATPCQRLPVKPALLSNACFLLTEPLFACDPDVRLDKD